MAWKYLLYLTLILPAAIAQDDDESFTPFDDIPLLDPSDADGSIAARTVNANDTAKHTHTTNSTAVTIKAGLAQVNSTHISVSLTNPNAFDVSLLTWNSFLEEAAEYHSFSVQPTPGGAELEPGDATARFIYEYSRIQNSYMRLQAGGNWSTVFDVTRAFKIPSRGAYRVEFQNAFPGVKTNGSGDRTSPDSVKVESVPQVFTFAASSPSRQPARRDTLDVLAGCSDQRKQIQWAINGTKVMANDAYTSTNDTLFVEYFGATDKDPQTKASVVRTLGRTFYNLNHYNYNSDKSISFNCDPNDNKLQFCKGSKYRGYYLPDDHTINLCQAYFDGEALLACVEPGPNRGSVQDQMSTVYHELTHDNNIASQKVLDWSDPNNAKNGCYNYNCATGFAKKRDQNMLPERSAINLQQYAQALRHRNHPDWGCSKNGAMPGHESPPPPPSDQASDAWAGDGACMHC